MTDRVYRYLVVPFVAGLEMMALWLFLWWLFR